MRWFIARVQWLPPESGWAHLERRRLKAQGAEGAEIVPKGRSDAAVDSFLGSLGVQGKGKPTR